MQIYGNTVDDETRCVHYRTRQDVVAIKFRCCSRFYPCHLCHGEAESHPAGLWPVGEWSERAILCGVCKETMSITEYRQVTGCPSCHAAFNEGCKLHEHLYFEVPTAV